MPDSPALGEYRAEFGGLLGTIEERPTDEGPGFAGASKIVSTEDLFQRLENHQDEHVDTRAYLAARLVDLLLGDWDRHQDQWRWARLSDGPAAPWTPIPRDRDQAFSRYDGLLLSLARLSAPQLVEFSPTYPSIVGLTWNARVVDRRLLTGLEWPVWDSIATALQGEITDAVIDDAVHRMPPELRAKNEAWLAGALKHRRDALPKAARRFYRLLAGEAEVFGSDKAERVTAVRADGRVLDLTVRAADDSAAAPLFHRRFDRADTKEVRLYLHGGDDVVQISGAAGGAPLLRIVGWRRGRPGRRFVDRRRGPVLRRARDERGRGHPPGAAGRPAVQRLAAERFHAVSPARLGRLLALSAMAERRAGSRPLLRRRARALRLRLSEAALSLENGAPGRLRDRRRDVPRRVRRRLPPRQLARADEPAAPRLGHRGGAVLRLRQRDAADRLGFLLSRPAEAVSHSAQRGVSRGAPGQLLGGPDAEVRRYGPRPRAVHHPLPAVRRGRVRHGRRERDR